MTATPVASIPGTTFAKSASVKSAAPKSLPEDSPLRALIFGHSDRTYLIHPGAGIYCLRMRLSRFSITNLPNYQILPSIRRFSVSPRLVHHTFKRLPLHVTLQIRGKNLIVATPHILRQKSCVGSDKRLRHLPQRRPARQRLFLKHVERRSGDLVFTQSFHYRPFVLQRTA